MASSKDKEKIFKHLNLVLVFLSLPFLGGILAFFIEKKPVIKIYEHNINKIEIINMGEGAAEIKASLFYVEGEVHCLNNYNINEVSGVEYIKYNVKENYSLVRPGETVEIVSCTSCKEDSFDNFIENMTVFILYKGKGMFNTEKNWCHGKDCNYNRFKNFSESCLEKS